MSQRLSPRRPTLQRKPLLLLPCLSRMVQGGFSAPTNSNTAVSHAILLAYWVFSPSYCFHWFFFFDPPERWNTRLTVCSLPVLLHGSLSKVWDTYTGDVLHSFPHQHIVRAGDFSGDGNRIVTGGMEKKLRIFDLNREDMAGQALLTNEGHSSVIRNVVWDGPRNMILSSGEDSEIR